MNVVVVVLLLAITLARLQIDGGRDAISALYVIPVAIMAGRNGTAGGVVTMAVTIWLLAATVLATDRDDFTLLGIATRVGAIVAVSLIVGRVADQRDDALARRSQPRPASVDVRNDDRIDLLSGLLDAKRSLERNDEVRALSIVRELGGSARELEHALSIRPNVDDVGPRD